MSGTGNGSKYEYTFKKLQGSHNYKQWTRDMSFALEEARLWRHVEGTAVAPPPPEAKKDDSEDRMEKIYAREEKICEFRDNDRKAVAKIGKMCTETVQKEFLSVKVPQDWTPKDLWDHLKTRYTLQNWASKWNTLGKLHEIRYGDCKNIQEFVTKIRDVKSEIEDLEITMDEAITIQVLHSLDSSFTQFLGIRSHEAREKAKLPTLESLAKSLEDEELGMKNQDKATANYAKRFTKKKIDSGATDHFFSNRAYFSTYGEHHHEFQTGSGEVLAAHGYGDVILRLAH